MITSNTNERIKEIKKLFDKKYRISERKYIIEGIKIIEEAYLKNENFVSIVICNEILENMAIDTKNIQELINSNKDKIIEVNEQVFKNLSLTVAPQGIIAVLEMRKNVLDDYSNNVLFLDNIQDAGNLGTIIRSACAFGFNTILMNKGCVDIYNDKVLRATMGNIFKIEFVQLEDNGITELNKLKNMGYKIYCTTLENAKDITKVEFNKKRVLVIGNEANGVSGEIISNSDTNIIIPMYNNTESLNAGIAASIAMYEINKKA